MTLPLVSVVIPAYNAESTIKRCIESVLGDAHKSVEIIVVDDGSTDRTAEYIGNLASSCPEVIRLVRQPNRGACAARNAGMDAARGEFIQFLDSDDELVDDKLQRAVLQFQENVDLQCVYCDMQFFIDSKPDRVGQAAHQNIRALADRESGYFTCGLNTNLPVWRSRFLRECRLRWNEKLPCWQESVYYVELLTELGSARSVFHDGAVGIRFHRKSALSGVSSAYWSGRYISGQLEAIRILYERCVSKGMPAIELRKQYVEFLKRLMVRSVVGNSRDAWQQVVQVAWTVRLDGMLWRLFARLPFPVVRAAYLVYRSLRHGSSS